MIGKPRPLSLQIGMSKLNLFLLCDCVKEVHKDDATVAHLADAVSSAMDALHAHVFAKEKEA